MSLPIPEEDLAAIKEALYQGRKIDAIKRYRESATAGLAEAKTAVEQLEAELRAASPEKFSATPAGKGCFGAAAMICLLVLVGAVWYVAR